LARFIGLPSGRHRNNINLAHCVDGISGETHETDTRVTFDAPDNLEPIAVGDGYQAQYRALDRRTKKAAFLQSADMNAEKCLPLRGGTGGAAKGHATTALSGARLTRNDLVDIRVSGDDTFNGDYVASCEGTLNLRFLASIRPRGRLTSEIENAIAAQLLAGDYYADRPRISVRVADFASVTVGVAGAVFEPHAVEIGGVTGDLNDGRTPRNAVRMDRKPIKPVLV